MLVKDYEKYINLSKLLNTTFGTGAGKNYATQSIKFDILDDGMLKCRYMTIVNFGSDTMMHEMKRRYSEEARSMVEAALKKLREDYKEAFPKQKLPTFKILENTIGDDVEFLTFSQYAGTRKGYYRFGCLVSID
jgi:hypothetical protein